MGCEGFYRRPYAPPSTGHISGASMADVFNSLNMASGWVALDNGFLDRLEDLDQSLCR